MGPSHVSILSQALEACREKLASEGFTVRLLDDFEEAGSLLRSCKKPVTPFFQTRFFDFNGANGFCHAVYLKDELISFYCSQLFDTGNLSYLDYHQRQLLRIYGESYPVDLSWRCEPMKAISGRVIYSGDALNAPGHRSAKASMKRLQLLARMNLYVGLLSWPDAKASVGLARAKHVALGLGAAYGAYHTYPYATRWITPPPDRCQDDVFLFSWQADILYQAQIDALGLEAEASSLQAACSCQTVPVGYSDTTQPLSVAGTLAN